MTGHAVNIAHGKKDHILICSSSRNKRDRRCKPLDGDVIVKAWFESGNEKTVLARGCLAMIEKENTSSFYDGGP